MVGRRSNGVPMAAAVVAELQEVMELDNVLGLAQDRDIIVEVTLSLVAVNQMTANQMTDMKVLHPLAIMLLAIEIRAVLLAVKHLNPLPVFH
jgi:hypothetical protein